MNEEPKKNLIGKLQGQPYETRIKILWMIVFLAGVAMVFLMVDSIKNTVGNAGQNLVKIEASRFVAESSVVYATVERVEQTSTGLKIYVNFKNESNDILNLPKLSDINLRVGSNVLKAEKITDRQGNTFVQKILSNTQNFGVLYFPSTNAKNVVLIFGEMFLEKSPTNVFQQSLELDLETLSKSSNVRN